MAYTIAVAGKGGTGKTTLSSLIIAELLRRKNGSILAVDADPNSNLNELLNIQLENTLGDITEEVIKKRGDFPGGMDRRRYLEYRIQMCLIEETGFDFIAMGRTEGPACYCSVNNMLRGIMDELNSSYKYIVMDNEAGMEHLSRRTTRDVDALLVVSDESIIGVRSAGRIYQMGKSLDIVIGKAYLVVNRAHETLPAPLMAEIDKVCNDTSTKKGLEFLGTVPVDENIVEYALHGRSLLQLPSDVPARKTISKLLDGVIS